jgi:hypothetical protein
MLQPFDVRYLVGIGAGLAAALLCLAVRQGTLAAYLLAYLAPLPIMIATLGFGALPGLAAALSATATIIVFVAARPAEPWTAHLIPAAMFGGLFAASLSGPAWWLARLARLVASETGSWRDLAGAPAAKIDARIYYPLSRILAYAVGFAFIATALVVAVIVFDAGGFDAVIERLAARFAPFILDIVGTHELPTSADLEQIARFYVKLIPPVATYTYLLLIVANLWLAGRIVQGSHLLLRPWPDIPRDLRLPRPFAIAFLASLALAVLDGLAGTIAACAAAACGMGFVLQGLAVIHALTRGLKFRAGLLAAIYAAAALLPLVLVPLAMVGLVDAGFAFRSRKGFAAPQRT